MPGVAYQLNEGEKAGAAGPPTGSQESHIPNPESSPANSHFFLFSMLEQMRGLPTLFIGLLIYISETDISKKPRR